MRPVRPSLFDLIRQREQSLKDAKLVERAHRENGLSIGEKITDIYIIFQFSEGANNMLELRQCISKSPRRLTDKANDSLITDICVKLTNRTNTKHTDNAVIIALILELKQSLAEGGQNINGEIEQMMNKYDTEVKNLACKIDAKDIELINLKTQLTELRDKNTKLHSEMKLKTQQLKDLGDVNKETVVQKETTSRILNRLESIDGKC